MYIYVTRFEFVLFNEPYSFKYDMTNRASSKVTVIKNSRMEEIRVPFTFVNVFFSRTLKIMTHF